jgi:nucleotide-binding universal stress UspA family protein
MSIKTILAYLPSEKSAPSVLEPTLNLAFARNAHVIGLHLIPEIPLYGEFPGEVSPDVIERIQKAGKDAADAARRVFEPRLAESKVSGEWRCFSASYGLGTQLIGQQARGADLIVCAKGDEEEPDAWDDFAETAILNGGRPVLIVPLSHRQKTIGKHVVIAWNDTREAARAVFDSLDLIKDAVTVRAITLIESEAKRAEAQSLGANLVANLARHGIKASFAVTNTGNADAGETILSALLDEGCDLLVMGGYGHSRFREMLFGGVSREILRETWVPVLASH